MFLNYKGHTKVFATFVKKHHYPVNNHKACKKSFVHIIPVFLVFQWLVSQVLETRQARGEAIRRYATYQFDQVPML